MAQTPSNAIRKKPVPTPKDDSSAIDKGNYKTPENTSTEQDSVNSFSSKSACMSTKTLFKYCLSVDAGSQLYREIRSIFLSDLAK